MSETGIRKEFGDTKGRFVASTPSGEAELTVSIASPVLVIADHTGVPKAEEGQGIAGRLVAALVADARAEGYRIVPLCPYVAAWFRRHPEHSDLVSGR